MAHFVMPALSQEKLSKTIVSRLRELDRLLTGEFFLYRLARTLLPQDRDDRSFLKDLFSVFGGRLGNTMKKLGSVNKGFKGRISAFLASREDIPEPGSDGSSTT